MSTNFESQTELVRFSVIVNDGTGRVNPCSSWEAGMMQARNYLSIGVSSRVVEERGYYVKQAYAMGQDGNWIYRYDLVWKQVN